MQAALPNPPDPPGVDDPRRDGGVGADAGTPYGRALREQLLGLPPLPTSSGSLGTAAVDGGASPAVPQRLTAGVEVAAGILGGADWPSPPPQPQGRRCGSTHAPGPRYRRGRSARHRGRLPERWKMARRQPPASALRPWSAPVAVPPIGRPLAIDGRFPASLVSIFSRSGRVGPRRAVSEPLDGGNGGGGGGGGGMEPALLGPAHPLRSPRPGRDVTAGAVPSGPSAHSPRAHQGSRRTGPAERFLPEPGEHRWQGGGGGGGGLHVGRVRRSVGTPPRRHAPLDLYPLLHRAACAGRLVG